MAQFDRLSVLNSLIAQGMMPLFYEADPARAQQVAGALARGGCRLLEFTNRGDFALDVFGDLLRYCQQKHPDLILGVGSVEDAPTAALYLAKGANFIVAPTFQEEVARLCNRRKVAYLPGCMTVNEIARAEEWGVEIVKLFPAEGLHGAQFVKSLLAPRPWTRIMPTGGVSPQEDNLRAWFGAGVACVGMGSQLIRKAWVEAGDYEALATQTRDTLALIARIRGSG